MPRPWPWYDRGGCSIRPFGGGPIAGDDQNFEHNLALSIRLWDATVQPSASFVLALDDDANDAIDLMFVLGVQVPLY